jgi:peptidoglycan/xylan/chitin deacetylase (PgdA/CDA1 family)
MTTAAEAFWRMPYRFGVARILGRSYSLRCVVFHHISAKPSPFTTGTKVTTSPKDFENALSFLTAHYTPVHLQEVLTDCDGRGLPPRAVLVTFDDAYASVAEWGAPLCRRFGVPAVFFVNAAFLDNQQLAPDNLVCYVANVMGMDVVNNAVRAVKGHANTNLRTLVDVFGNFFPAISLSDRDVFLDALRQQAGVDENRLAIQAKLYLTSQQLRDMPSFDFEIGNHTYSHPYCRLLSKQDFKTEIDKNRAELESISGTKVRSFSLPYGSSKDLTPELAEHIESTGHQAAFFSESVANPERADLFHIDRVSTCADSDDKLFLEIEVLPRLRAVRNRLSHDSALRPSA